MEEEFATIVYVELAPSILVPYEWPIRGLESLVLTLAEEIIAQDDSVKSILQVKNIPAKLIRHIDSSGFTYVFEKVPTEETVGCYVYDIVLPKDEDSIRVDMSGGSSSHKGSWPNYVTSVSPRSNKTSYYLTPPQLHAEMLRSMDTNTHALRRRLTRNIKQMTQQNNECNGCGDQ
ncbi:uncharacterized protein LOC130664940 [Microplitis mediator]|uniref:uncharacterized protein LOC130664940 n=1 Tax=Microplitis mediator TaxID=375433 RepID=UPI00255600BF|nr:uncharacterized protein LOC130664940 [Microplitis mediator]